MNATLLQASEFGRLFRSSPAAHGCFIPNGTVDKNGKALGQYRTELGPILDDNVMQHLDGHEGLGAIPIIAPDLCWFGAIDVDIHDAEVLAKVRKAIYKNDFPLVPFKSKSGGLHLYIFFHEPQPAPDVIEVLGEMRRLLGLASNVEIFPKQKRVDGQSLGNWINLPYYNFSNSTRPAVAASGIAMGFDEAIEYCKYKMTTIPDVREFLSHVPLIDGPPCLQVMRILGVDSLRNEYLFSYARYAKARYPDTWESEVQMANQDLDQPIPPDELENTVLKSHRKKDYAYKCSADPLKPMCMKSLCSTREFGVGGMNVSELSYEDLVQVMSDPPYYEWTINGKVMRFYSENDLLKQDEFRKQCVRYLHIVPNRLKDSVWVKILNNAFQNIKVTEQYAGDDISVGSQFRQLLGEFLTKRVPAANRTQVLMGRVFKDEEQRRYLFKGKELVHFLHTVKQFRAYAHAEIQTKLLDLGATPVRLYIDQANRNARLWSVSYEVASELGSDELKDIEPIDFLEDLAGDF